MLQRFLRLKRRAPKCNPHACDQAQQPGTTESARGPQFHHWLCSFPQRPFRASSRTGSSTSSNGTDQTSPRHARRYTEVFQNPQFRSVPFCTDPITPTRHAPERIRGTLLSCQLPLNNPPSISGNSTCPDDVGTFNQKFRLARGCQLSSL